MTKRRKLWMHPRLSPKKRWLPDMVKGELSTKGLHLLHEHLKPTRVWQGPSFFHEHLIDTVTTRRTFA